jgi:AhpD family alkylhydroperoxidase
MPQDFGITQLNRTARPGFQKIGDCPPIRIFAIERRPDGHQTIIEMPMLRLDVLVRVCESGLEGTMPEKFTQQRIDAMKTSPEAFKAMSALQAFVEGSGLERSLLKLVEIRASQINGCALCLAMHTNDARQLGESDERMHLLNAWREAPVFSARERGALAWTEAVTLINENHVPDDVYDEARRQFSEKELVDLTAAVVAINGWNRAAIAFRAAPKVGGSKVAA